MAIIHLASSDRQQYGFNLIELMIVIAIVAIIASIAYPSYQDQVRKGRRTDGQEFLMALQSLQERYSYDENTYTADMKDLNYTATSNVLTADGAYKVSILAPTADCPIVSCYILQATPEMDAQKKDGLMQLTSTGLYFRDKNHDGDVSDAGEDTW